MKLSQQINARREREQHEGLMASSPATKLPPPLYKTTWVMREKKSISKKEREQKREGRERDELKKENCLCFFSVFYNQMAKKGKD